jgi:hypothetical protein
MKQQIQKLLDHYRQNLKSRHNAYTDCEAYRSEGEESVYEDIINDLEKLLADDEVRTEYESDFQNWWEEKGKIDYPVPALELAFKEIAFRGWNASVGRYFGYEDYFES